jgi:DNA-binding NarL/FixJ family response regulator
MQAGAVLLIEDHPLFRDALTRLVRAAFPHLEAVTASSAEEGLRAAAARADVRLVILDPGLPGLDGAGAVAAVRSACAQAPVVAVSASEDRHEATAVLRAGAMAFVSKAVPTAALSDILLRVAAGELQHPEWITPQGSARLDTPDFLLTPRQGEILALLAQGKSNKEIGLHLTLAEPTVKMHVSAIFRALGVVNRTQAVLAARRLGLMG